MKLVSVAEMRAVEKEADGNGLTYDRMMENAGHNLADEVMELAYHHDEDEEIQILGLVGPGNNGGDTLVALTRLAEKGWTARAYLANRKIQNDPLAKRLEGAGGEIYFIEGDPDYHQLQVFIESTDVLLDGVLGTGFQLPLKKDIGDVLIEVKNILSTMEWPPLVIAVDCPSGIDCDTGEAAEQTLFADATVTMAAVKVGLLKLPAHDYCGEIRVIPIGDIEGIKAWDEIRNEVADHNHIAKSLPARKSDAHKGSFGTAMVVAGSLNYTGAALLAGKSAYRVGVGLVTLAIPAPLHTTLAGHLPEATWLLLPHELGVIAPPAAEVIQENIGRTSALLVGPGIGLDDRTKEFLVNFLDSSILPGHTRMGFVQNINQDVDRKNVLIPPMVMDADGLKLLAKLPEWPKRLPSPAILTPHPGEMAILTGLTIGEIQSDRLAIARKFSLQWGHVVVLKGAFTVIASPDGRTTTIPVATPALAKAGTGDVLAGIIVGLRAQGMEAYEAAVAGAWIHGQAGLAAAENVGSVTAVIAGDVLDAVPDVLEVL